MPMLDTKSDMSKLSGNSLGKVSCMATSSVDTKVGRYKETHDETPDCMVSSTIITTGNAPDAWSK